MSFKFIFFIIVLFFSDRFNFIREIDSRSILGKENRNFDYHHSLKKNFFYTFDSEKLDPNEIQDYIITPKNITLETLLQLNYAVYASRGSGKTVLRRYTENYLKNSDSFTITLTGKIEDYVGQMIKNTGKTMKDWNFKIFEQMILIELITIF